MNESKNRKTLLKNLRRKKVMTIDEIAAHLGYAVITSRLKLKQWDSFRSCNKNGRFYTLAEIPRFNVHGLWHHKDIFFSRHGNLSETVVQLVSQSPGGLTSREIADLVGISPTSAFFSQIHSHLGLKREKIYRKNYWFSTDANALKVQRRQRLTPVHAGLPTDQQAIMIFAEMIKCPEHDTHDVALKLGIEPAKIFNLLEKHKIKKK